jgi:hypothetical protein
MGEERLRGVLEPRGEVSMACRSTKELTVPVTPRLRTSHRPADSRSASFDDLDAPGPYVPLAERIRKNNEQGPRGKPAAPAAAGPYVKPGLTAPKTPEFSSFRRKEATARGFAASEAEQLEEMKRHQFKARPVRSARRRVVGPGGGGHAGVARRAADTRERCGAESARVGGAVGSAGAGELRGPGRAQARQEAPHPPTVPPPASLPPPPQAMPALAPGARLGTGWSGGMARRVLREGG